MHPQYRFISLQSFVRLTLHFIPLKALSFISLHSSRIMSAALSFFSGCSFAQPSGLAPLPFSCVFPFFGGPPLWLQNSSFKKHPIRSRWSLCPKSRNSAAADVLYFFPAVSRCYSFSLLRKRRSVLGLAWLFDCRNPATALLEKKTFPLSLQLFFFCGAWGC